MTSAHAPNRKRRVGAGLALAGVLLVVLIAALEQIDVPHPWVYSPTTSAQRIESIPENRRWMVTHGYGALCAQIVDLEEIRHRADALPPGLDAVFYDGAAHDQQVDLSDVPTWVQSIQRHIPAQHQAVFFDGIMRRFVEQEGAAPDRVLPFADTLATLTGTKDLSNGIRIGLQQSLGDNMHQAIEAAAAYPTSLHHPLFEELGWRVGNDEGLQAGPWQQYTDQVPPAAQCSFAAGMVRGAVLIDLAEERDWWPAVEGFATHQAASCSAQARNGLTEALLIALGDRPDVMHDELQRIASPTDRQAVWALVQQRLVDPPTP